MTPNRPRVLQKAALIVAVLKRYSSSIKMLNLCLQEERDKKKRKIRLEMHMEQYFDDGLDAYVWIYDPIPFYYWLFGALVVLAAIAICMFPLWPPTVRYVLLQYTHNYPSK